METKPIKQILLDAKLLVDDLVTMAEKESYDALSLQDLRFAASAMHGLAFIICTVHACHNQPVGKFITMLRNVEKSTRRIKVAVNNELKKEKTIPSIR